MKKRIIAFFLVLLLASSLLLSPLAAAYSRQLPIFHTNVDVLSMDTLGNLLFANYNLTGDYNNILIKLIVFKSWDGDLSSYPVTSAMKELHVSSSKKNKAMTIIFDIEEGNYDIIIGNGIKDLFDDTMADQYLENYFRSYYESGNYDLAVTSLVSALANWYEQNYDQIIVNQSNSANYYRWYKSPVFIVFAAIIIIVLLHILYGVVCWIARFKHSFDEYYMKLDLPIPVFHIWYIWTSPFFDNDYPSIWSHMAAIWKEEHPIRSCFQPSDIKRNIFDIIAIIIKLVLLVFIGIFLLLLLIIGGGGGGNSNDSSDSGSGSGGGGHSGGGGGGHR